MKRNRHEAILALVEKEELGTQEELMSRLHELGYNVTQATVSRDIKALKLRLKTAAISIPPQKTKMRTCRKNSFQFLSIP